MDDDGDIKEVGSSRVVTFSEDVEDSANQNSTTDLQKDHMLPFESSESSERLCGIKLPSKITAHLPSQSSVLKWSSFILYNVYLGYAIYFHLDRSSSCSSEDDCWGWCNGLGFILIVTGLVYISFTYFAFKKYLLPVLPFQLKNFFRRNLNFLHFLIENHLIVRIGLYVSVISLMIAFFVWDTWNDKQRLISAAGIVVIVLFGAIFSKFPRQINWRQVVWGVTLQLIFGLLILRWETGKAILDCVSKKVDRFLAFSDDGSGFVFGFLVNQQPFIPNRVAHNELAFNITTEINASRAVSSVVVFRSLSVIYFFCFVTNILFYFGVVQWITAKLGWLLNATICTTPCESMNAASNIFLGQAVAPLLIKPYIEKLTMSEIHAVITSGFATIAGTVMAAFITFGVSPAHLLSASFMSAPAALACSKLLYPEKEKSKLSQEEIRLESGCGESTNLLDAATRGATEGATLVLHITAIVVAFIASVAFLNTLVSFFGGLVGYEEVTFEWILGKIFIPVVYMMGVAWEECETVAKLVGIKTIVNEFIAYQKLGVLMKEGVLSNRAVTIATYALCGYANPGSIGVTLASLGGICPQRRNDFSKLVVRAFVAGNEILLMLWLLFRTFALLIFIFDLRLFENGSTENGNAIEFKN
jgi:pyrimidine nucleoside transport protein